MNRHDIGTRAQKPEPTLEPTLAQPVPSAGLVLDLQRTVGNALVAQALARRSALRIGRVHTDFPVTGLHERTKAATETRSLYFERNSAALEATEQAKLKIAAKTEATRVELRGFASEDEDERKGLIEQRLGAVERFLREAGYKGALAHAGDAQASEGKPDYRHERRVDLIDPTVPESAQQRIGAGLVLVDLKPEQAEARITGVAARAAELLAGAEKALGNENAASAVSTFFGQTPPADIATSLALIAKQLANMRARKGALVPASPTDVTSRDARAWTEKSGPEATITFGAAFSATTFTIDEWATTLVHELTHAEPAIRGRDFAYAADRLFTRLPPELARRNPDSYAALVARLNGIPMEQLPEKAPGHDDKSDEGATEEQLQAVKDALAWIERYASASFSAITDLYTRVTRTTTAKPLEPVAPDNAVAKLLEPLAGAPASGLEYRVALVGIRDVFARVRRACQGRIEVWGANDETLKFDDFGVVYAPKTFKTGDDHKRAVFAAMLTTFAGTRAPKLLTIAEGLGERKELPPLK